MIINCKMCGGYLAFTPGATYGTCEFCGSTSTIPQADDEGKLNCYNRANHFRRQGEFDKAVAAYEKLLEQDDTDAEAHWGAVISRYGIEYVEDPATKKRIPTFHRVQVASILADADYLAAVEHAPDSASRDLYKQHAAEIAEVQKGILAISVTEKPYDVFICYKETDEQGQRTRDSQWAQDVYYGLTEQGYKVFFSRITLEDKLGQQYEPYIFAALNSAKVMVVIGSKPEYFNAVWVKNEWSRYLALMAKDRKRLLIPCYRGMDPNDLPEELSILQSQDMSKIGFLQDLLRGVKKVLDADRQPEQPRVVQQVVQDLPTVSGSTAPLLRRVFLFLEDGDWQSADEYCEKVLDIEPENGRAYLGKLMVELKVRTEDKLSHQNEPFDGCKTYQKAIRFGDAAQQNKLKADNDAIRRRIEHKRQAVIYNQACELLRKANTIADCQRAKAKFQAIPQYEGTAEKLRACDQQQEAIQSRYYVSAVELMGQAGESSAKWAEVKKVLANSELDGYKDVVQLRARAAKRYDETLAAEKEAAEEAIRSRLYETAVTAMQNAGDSSSKWDEAKKKLAERELDGFRDVAELRVRAAKRYDECVAAEKEAQRQKEEKARRETEAAAARKKRNTILGIVAALVIAVGIYVVTQVIIPGNNYNNAVQLLADGKYQEASGAFAALGGYKDAAARVNEPFYVQGKALMSAGKYETAIAAFEKANGYKDSATQIKEAKYQQAGGLNASGKYAEAYALYATISGYKDVDSLLVNDHNLAAVAAAAREPFTKVGNIVTYGHYEQDNNSSNGKEAIEWIVLKYDSASGKSLLLSRYGLDAHRFDASEYQGWDKSEMRSWLNSTFLNNAFTAKEQEGIATTTVRTGNNAEWVAFAKKKGWSYTSMDGGADTQDKVFLLSLEEAMEYGGYSTLTDFYNNVKDKVKATPTKYAVAQGAYQSDTNKLNGTGCCWWWLRSPGYYSDSASGIRNVGSLNHSCVYYSSGSVLPAFWLNLGSADIY